MEGETFLHDGNGEGDCGGGGLIFTYLDLRLQFFGLASCEHLYVTGHLLARSRLPRPKPDVARD